MFRPLRLLCLLACLVLLGSLAFPWLDIDGTVLTSEIPSTINAVMPQLSQWLEAGGIKVYMLDVARLPVDSQAALHGFIDASFADQMDDPSALDPIVVFGSGFIDNDDRRYWAFLIWLTPIGAALSIAIYLIRRAAYVPAMLATLPPVGIFFGSLMQRDPIAYESLTSWFYAALAASAVIWFVGIIAWIVRISRSKPA
ncbi:MAG: hypothetical protein AAF414_22085 [Pseudomonadota bacterium]